MTGVPAMCSQNYWAWAANTRILATRQQADWAFRLAPAQVTVQVRTRPPFAGTWRIISVLEGGCACRWITRNRRLAPTSCFL